MAIKKKPQSSCNAEESLGVTPGSQQRVHRHRRLDCPIGAVFVSFLVFPHFASLHLIQRHWNQWGEAAFLGVFVLVVLEFFWSTLLVDVYWTGLPKSSSISQLSLFSA